MKKLKTGLIGLFSVFALVSGAQALFAPPTYAAECSAGQSPASCIKQSVNDAGGNSSANKISIGDRIKTIVNMILYVLGAIAVIMIVIGGVRYTTSGGDSGGVSGAKNTILYAVVGLVVAILAYAIVNFVLESFI